MELQEKILIIRAENTLIRLIISFFPDTYIHDIRLDNGLEKNANNDKKTITLLFIFYKDRGIAIGRSGGYINVVNEIFEKYIFFKDYDTPIEIKCDFINL
jgi:transcription antitermination factor NusA-like protein